MIAEKRHEMIIRLIQVEGIVDVDYLSHYLEVSPKTIRLDLSNLEKKGLLKRVHGGAVVKDEEPEKNQTFTSIRRRRFVNEKKIIAKKARQLINDGDVILLDDGSTILELAKILDGVNVTVLTNDIQILNVLLAKPNVNLYIIGGRIQRDGQSFLVTGNDAIDYMKRFRVNKLFLGTSTVDVVEGLMLFYYGDSSIKRAFIDSADQVICLADSSKFGASAFIRFAQLSDVDIVITDGGITQEQIDRFKEIDCVELIVVK